MQASSIVVQKAYTRDIFDGAKPDMVDDFQAEFPHVTYEEFAHITSVVCQCRRARALLHGIMLSVDQPRGSRACAVNI